MNKTNPSGDWRNWNSQSEKPGNQIMNTQNKMKKSGLRGTLKVSSLDIQTKQSGYNSKVFSSDYFYLELLNQHNTANIQIHYLDLLHTHSPARIQIHYLVFSINIYSPARIQIQYLDLLHQYIVQHVFRFITWIFSIHIIQPIFRFNHSQQSHLPPFISFSLIIIHYKKYNVIKINSPPPLVNTP